MPGTRAEPNHSGAASMLILGLVIMALLQSDGGVTVGCMLILAGVVWFIG
jgi:hypothetical protein